jgi:ATP synthase protein I
MPFNNPIPGKDPQPRDKGGIGTLIQAEKLTQIAVLLPSAVFLGWLIGGILDSKLHQHWISLAGIVFGGISGLVYVVRLVMANDGSKPAGGQGGAAARNSSDTTRSGNPDARP